MKNTMRLFTLSIFLIIASISFAQEKTAPVEEKKGMMKGSGIQELDAFHALLHPLVHEAYPKNDFAAIKDALPKLIESAAALKGATLPEPLSGKNKAFRAESKKLATQLAQLSKKRDTLSDDEFGKRFMKMHDTFEKLMELTK
jgi:hypothetical protein